MKRQPNNVFRGTVAGIGLAALAGGVVTLKTQWPAECDVRTVGRTLSQIGDYSGEDQAESVSWSLMRCDAPTRAAILNLPQAAQKIVRHEPERLMETLLTLERAEQERLLEQKDVVERLSTNRDTDAPLMDLLQQYPLADQTRYMARFYIRDDATDLAEHILGTVRGMPHEAQVTILKEMADDLVEAGQVDTVWETAQGFSHGEQADLLRNYSFVRSMTVIGMGGDIVSMMGAWDKAVLADSIAYTPVMYLAEAGLGDEFIALLGTLPQKEQEAFFRYGQSHIRELTQNGYGMALRALQETWKAPEAPPPIWPFP